MWKKFILISFAVLQTKVSCDFNLRRFHDSDHVCEIYAELGSKNVKSAKLSIDDEICDRQLNLFSEALSTRELWALQCE